MRRTIGHSIVLTVLLIALQGLLPGGGNAVMAAARVAILPPADLSQGINAVSLHLGRAVADILTDKDIGVVPGSEIIDFFARHRIRQTGLVTSATVLLAGKELGADYLLVASLCQRVDAPASIGLTATLYRTNDGLVIWSDSAAVSAKECQRLLGIDNPTNADDLLPVVLDRLFADLPELNGTPAVATWQIAAAPPPEILIESTRIQPQVVRPGEQVHCLVRLRPLAGPAPKVYIKAGNTLHQAELLPDRSGFEVSWTAPRKRPVRPTRVAVQEGKGVLYRDLLDASRDDDEYPISLELLWPNQERQSVFLGTYRVDGTPPSFALRPKGTMYGGMAAFRDRLPISLAWPRPEPVTHWRVTVTDQNGQLLLEDEGAGRLPTTFVWDGTIMGGKATTGRYTFAVAATDRAGNGGEAAIDVLYQPQAPEPTITGCGGDRCLTIDADSPVAVTYWRLEQWNADEALLKTMEGDRLPATVHLAGPASEGRLILYLRDALGNRARRDIAHAAQTALLQAQQPEPTNQATDPGHHWLDEF